MNINLNKCHTCDYYHPMTHFCEYYLKGKENAVFLCPDCRNEKLPPAEPERKKGKWVGAQAYCKHLEEKTGERYVPSGIENMIYCDKCWQANDRSSSFCPNCGADMRGEE